MPDSRARWSVSNIDEVSSSCLIAVLRHMHLSVFNTNLRSVYLHCNEDKRPDYPQVDGAFCGADRLPFEFHE
jgi:hypothetical protein